LVGWDIEFACGPVPESATDVEVSAGNGDDVQSIKKESLSSVTVENGYVQFPAIKTTEKMDTKAGGLFCVFSNGANLLGATAPTLYSIHSQPSPRPNFDVKFNSYTCGLVDNIEQEIATCEVPKDQIKNVFPPIYLQWEVTLKDGEVKRIPENPEKTMSLALSVVADRAVYAGATIECVDYQPRDQNEALSSAEPGRTSPSNGASFEFRKLTDHITYNVEEEICSSNAYGIKTATEDECSDVAQWEEPTYTYCPATTSPGTVTCNAKMLNGKTLSFTWENPECTDVDTPHLPCEASSVEDCPPPLSPITDKSGEAGGSMIWLLFFAFAAVGGAILVFLNKRKEKAASQSEEDGEDKASLLNSRQEDEIENLSEIKVRKPSDSEFPYIDQTPVTENAPKIEVTQVEDVEVSVESSDDQKHEKFSEEKSETVTEASDKKPETLPEDTVKQTEVSAETVSEETDKKSETDN